MGVLKIYLQLRFNGNARLTSYILSGDPQPDIGDTIRMAYGGIEISYKGQDDSGKLASTSNSAAYSTEENKIVPTTF